MTTYDATQAFTANHDPATAADAVDALLAEPFGNWHVFAEDRELAVRVTKKGRALLHERRTDGDRADHASGDGPEPARRHDRVKPRLLPEDDPVLRALGISGDDGTVKPSRQAKYRQVEEFLRLLGAGLDDAVAAGALRTPTPEDPWLLVDLGCGNAYLTFAAHRWLTAVRGQPVAVVGVDAKAQSLAHNGEVATRLGVTDEVRFAQGLIDEVDLRAVAGSGRARPDVVMALHACDTATDDALASAVAADVPLVLAAPCCHHDVAAQLKRSRPEEGSRPGHDLLLRDGILRERFADTLTDALRAAALRLAGYRVDVVEFVESRHTPRNTLLRAVRTGAAAPGTAADLEALTSAWQVTPRLLTLLGPPVRPEQSGEPS